ncbi:MAG: carboxypeptidase-like regulatory domain-containing protein [Pyrinomonadaceae bacterium]
MFRKSLISIIFAGIVIFVGGVAVFAQSAPVTGTVEMLKADGTRAPVEGALVEVFRTDIKASSPPAKTNKRGEFNFAGLQLGWTFILSVSAPGAAPTYLTNVKAGQERLLITMSPGDGSKTPEAEVRAQAAKPKVAAGSPEAVQNTEEMKKAQADYEAKKKEVEEKNKKASQTNEIVTAALKAGNEAFAAKNMDLAIMKYDEGIAADPVYVGSAPIFYNNRGIALKTRGVDSYNVGIKAGADVSAKVEAFGKARKDFADASAGYLNSWNVLKNAPAADIVDKANYDSNKLGTLRGSIEVFQMAVRTEQVDPTVIDVAKIMIPEYQANEPDAAKKAAASLALADLYRVVGDSDNAIIAYKAILETTPDNPDALVGAGLSLVNIGYINNDKTKLQEGSNLLQKFVGLAPDTNKFKADAVALIDTLKKEQNVTPQKVTGPAKKKP